jgi:acetolactate synthase-1/2/3 large subunit
MRLVEELQKFLTPDVTVCSDMESFSLYLSRYPTSFRAHQFFNNKQLL